MKHKRKTPAHPGVFQMNKPCTHCPFRNDKTRCTLSASRAQEIAQSLLSGKMFTCHETINTLNGKGSRRNYAEERHCGGALIVLEKMERPNEFMVLFGRLGYYIREKLHMKAPVFNTLDEFTAANKR